MPSPTRTAAPPAAANFSRNSSTEPNASFRRFSSSPGMFCTVGLIICQNCVWFQCWEALLKSPFCLTAFGV